MTPEEKILAAWEAAQKLHAIKYCGIELKVKLGICQTPDTPEIYLGVQTASEDDAQRASDLLGLLLRREFSPTTGWFDYTGTASFGSVHIYAVRNVPGCTITKNPEAVPITWAEDRYLVECQGGPATIVPKET